MKLLCKFGYEKHLIVTLTFLLGQIASQIISYFVNGRKLHKFACFCVADHLLLRKQIKFYSSHESELSLQCCMYDHIFVEKGSLNLFVADELSKFSTN